MQEKIPINEITNKILGFRGLYLKVDVLLSPFSTFLIIFYVKMNGFIVNATVVYFITVTYSDFHIIQNNW